MSTRRLSPKMVRFAVALRKLMTEYGVEMLEHHKNDVSGYDTQGKGLFSFTRIEAGAGGADDFGGYII